MKKKKREREGKDKPCKRNDNVIKDEGVNLKKGFMTRMLGATTTKRERERESTNEIGLFFGPGQVLADGGVEDLSELPGEVEDSCVQENTTGGRS